MNVRELIRALSGAPDQDIPVAFVLGPYAGEDGRRTSELIAVPANVAYYDDPGRGQSSRSSANPPPQFRHEEETTRWTSPS